MNNYGFEIRRADYPAVGGFQYDGRSLIGFVEGHGNSNLPKNYSFIDYKVTSGKYAYRLKQFDNDGTFEYSKIIEIDVDAPLEFELSQNYPNPFNLATTIKFSLPVTLNVKLSVFNILGEEVEILVNETREAGIYTINFSATGGSAFGGNACTLPSGIYFYKIEARDFIKVKKKSLIR
ncbi:MAG: T9SS type A sorting domain-containing protein [Ignavibacteriaceae bacterium]